MAKDIPIGQVFINAGLIDKVQLQEALRKQKEMRPRRLIGEVLVELGHLQVGQNEMRVGEHLLYSNRINREQLDEALALQKQNRARFLGEILVEIGHIDLDEFVKVLCFQHRYTLNRSPATGRKRGPLTQL